MKKSRFLLASALASSSLLLMAQPAWSQDAAPQAAEDAASDDDGIVVTGTLIQNPGLKSSSPVTSVGRTEFELKQSGSAEQILREIPGVVAAIGQNVNNGTNGSATIDLRGLGENRNIVLLDGARVVPFNLAGSVDLNLIPLALVERVDVLTGGASTSYGADAVTGVVNFVTRKNFAGFEATISDQISARGDANAFRADLTIGANFDDGRGNATLSVGYQQADPLFFGKRKFSQFTVNSTTGRSAGNSPTSTPTVFSIPGAPGDGFVQVSPDGAMLTQPFVGFNFNPFNVFITPFERFNIFATANYEISDKLSVYTRGLFSKTTINQIIAPGGIFGETLSIAGNNPFLNATIRDQLCALNGLPTGAACAANPAIPLGNVYRRTVEIGPRQTQYTTNVFDYTAGLTYKISDSIKFDLYGAYGESENRQVSSGSLSVSRIRQALDAASTTACNDPSNGCVPLNIFGPTGSITAAQAAFVGGITTSIVNTASLAQVKGLVSGDFGFTSPFAEKPIAFAVGGEYRDYGATVEPDSLEQTPGELSGRGGATLPVNGGFDVREAFGELIVPVAAGMPFAHDLTVEAGVRYSKYRVDAAGRPNFNATTYKFGGNYEPVEGIKFRGNYQRAIRAPNIAELFSPVTTGLTNLTIDPCAGAAPSSNANLALACLNQGAAAGVIGIIPQPAAGQANITSGGNPNVKPEKASTYTFGVVLQPRDIIPGLTISLDYYNIKVRRAITTPTPGDIIFACFGANPSAITAAQANSAACTSIRRNPVNGGLSGSPGTVPGLFGVVSNSGTLKTDGVDLVIDYSRDLGFAQLNLNFSGNYTSSSKFKSGPTSTFRECAGFFSVNCGFSNGQLQPEFSFSQRSTLKFGKFDLSLLWRHIDSFRYEPGLTPLFSGTITGTGPLVGRRVNFNKIKSVDYFDLTTRVFVNDNVDITLSMFNIFDKKPPLVGSTAGSTTANGGNTFPSVYDAVGRRFAATAKFKF